MIPDTKRIGAVIAAAVVIGCLFILTGCAVAEYVVTQTACEALKSKVDCQ